MSDERRVRLFRDDRGQALWIPPEFELPGDEAIVRQVGDRLVIQPLKRKSLLEALASMELTDEEFPEIEDPPPEDVDF